MSQYRARPRGLRSLLGITRGCESERMIPKLRSLHGTHFECFFFAGHWFGDTIGSLQSFCHAPAAQRSSKRSSKSSLRADSVREGPSRKQKASIERAEIRNQQPNTSKYQRSCIHTCAFLQIASICSTKAKWGKNPPTL